MNINIVLGNAACIATIVGTYFIFQRCGEEGWKAIIPFYNTYTEYKLIWKKEMFWAQIGALIAALVFFGATFVLPFFIHSVIPSMLCTTLSGMSVAASVVIYVMESFKLAQHFGHGKGFTVGLIFFAPIFRMILGFEEKQISIA